MMMNRRHRENAFSGQPKTQNLKDHGNRFENEDAAYNREEQLLFATDCNDANHSADRERARVPHDDLGGMAVKPEKTQTGSNQRRTDHGKLARVGIERNLKVFRDAKIPGG